MHLNGEKHEISHLVKSIICYIGLLSPFKNRNLLHCTFKKQLLQGDILSKNLIASIFSIKSAFGPLFGG